MTEELHVGRSTPRVEDARLVTGAARWTDAMHVPGALHLAVVRSPMAHANLLNVDVQAAAAAPGVVAAFTGADLVDGWAAPLPAGGPRGAFVPDHWPLAVDRVRHVGDPVAVVVAENRHAAEDARELVDVDYEPLPAVPTVEAALRDETLVHEQAGTNTAFHYEGRPTGDVEAAFTQADVVIERRYHQQRLVPAALEPRAVLALPDPAGGLTLYTSTQIPHGLRGDL